MPAMGHEREEPECEMAVLRGYVPNLERLQQRAANLIYFLENSRSVAPAHFGKVPPGLHPDDCLLPGLSHDVVCIQRGLKDVWTKMGPTSYRWIAPLCLRASDLDRATVHEHLSPLDKRVAALTLMRWAHDSGVFQLPEALSARVEQAIVRDDEVFETVRRRSQLPRRRVLKWFEQLR